MKKFGGCSAFEVGRRPGFHLIWNPGWATHRCKSSMSKPKCCETMLHHVINKIDRLIWNKKTALWTLASCILLYILSTVLYCTVYWYVSRFWTIFWEFFVCHWGQKSKSQPWKVKSVIQKATAKSEVTTTSLGRKETAVFEVEWEINSA